MRISDWSSDVCSSDLLSGTTVYPLAAVQSASDPTRIALAYSLPAGAGSIVQVELADSEVNGGKLAGFLQFRRESLDAVQDQLGQLAIGLALAFNNQHEAGLDLNGDPGQAMFGLVQPPAIPTVGNEIGRAHV